MKCDCCEVRFIDGWEKILEKPISMFTLPLIAILCEDCAETLVPELYAELEAMEGVA